MAKKRKADSVIADFGHKDAKGGGGGRSDRVPEGDYVLKLVKIEKRKAKETDNTVLWAFFKIAQGPKKGKKIVERFTLTPKALFRLRNWLEAMGLEVPEKKTAIKYGKYVGEEVGATIVDGEEYKNRIPSEVGEFIPVDEVEEDDEDEDDDELEEDDELDEDEDDEDLEEVDLEDL